MRSYSSTIYRSASRSSPWRWVGIGLLIGFILGFILAHIINQRGPIALVVSNSSGGTQTPSYEGGASPQGVWSAQGSFSIESPVEQGKVKSPFAVEGTTSGSDGKVTAVLYDSNNKELARKEMSIQKKDEVYGSYKGELTFEKAETKKGTLEVSRGTGVAAEKISILVSFE